MDRLELPIGDASFGNIRTSNCYYVDKTTHLWNLTKGGGRYYFLSRPRRFGKSLLISTLKELFEGNEELFRGLHIHENRDWSIQHPVIRLSFGGKYNESGELGKDVMLQLRDIERRQDLEPDTEADTGPTRLRSLIERLYYETGQQVVVLVDEYDKPVLDTLENQELAQANRDYLRGFYGVIKDCADMIRFVFVTGISMYSKVSLFSNLNNLYDLSLDPEYATLCGYTQNDLETVFAPEMEGLADTERENIRHWYNGYHWRGQEKVYNPFDILLYFRNREFIPWWYETGTPSFLYQRMASGEINTRQLQNLEMPRADLARFEVENIDLNALLFQCGYLTIAGESEQYGETFYLLDYPNHEVRLSLNRQLLTAVSGRSTAHVLKQGGTLIHLLADNDFTTLAEQLQSLFAGMPHAWHDQNDMARYEGYYASMLFSSFNALNLDIRVEDASSHGRADMAVIYEGQVFVFEFKVADESETKAKARQALVQMNERGYADKYRTDNRRIHLLAAIFSRKKRNLALLETQAG